MRWASPGATETLASGTPAARHRDMVQKGEDIQMCGRYTFQPTEAFYRRFTIANRLMVLSAATTSPPARWCRRRSAAPDVCKNYSPWFQRICYSWKRKGFDVIYRPWLVVSVAVSAHDATTDDDQLPNVS
jgi:hypothetical protein